uniref:Putative tick transposon n=1 Tax=Rhipicephalus microplus TaxID=6941 RepID=A0A6G5AHX8_RHIMP
MVLPQHSDVPFAVIHLDFAELKKKAAGVRRMQSFLVAIDQCTRIVAARPRREDAKSVIAILSWEMFKNMKIGISDNGPAFLIAFARLGEGTRSCIATLHSYHPAGNGMAERIIRDLKQFISMYPGFQGGWKCCLEAAVAHHNRSHTASIGCSPYLQLSERYQCFLLIKNFALQTVCNCAKNENLRKPTSDTGKV